VLFVPCHWSRDQFFFLRHLISLSVVVTVQRSNEESGPCSGDSVPCITCKYQDYFSHNSLEVWLPIDIRSCERGGVLRSFHFLVMVSFFLFFFHPEATSVYICTPLHVHYYSLQSLTAGTTFGHLKIALDCLVTSPFSYLSCHGNKLEF
jgi:hypothetical protein